ncbi:fimbrial biogenesis chaperone [Radicibacter daui]|uniref:fimbrial biogenesis chaperone n=1 Tax=Radicibacter daui TaxID=3064829 RepID=UPI004046F22F
MRRPGRPVTRFALLAALLSFLPSAPANAALQVSPVTLELPAARPAATLLVSNNGNRDSTIQVRAFDWHQPNGSDDLQPTTSLLVSPPLFTLKPGEEQVVRVLLRQSPPSETGYRLLVDELPVAEGQQQAIQLPIRFSLPVFAGTTGNAKSSLAWSASRSPGGGFSLTASNSGARRAKLANLVVKTPDGQEIARQDGLAGYVLAGESRLWRLDAAGEVLPAKLEVNAVTEAGPLSISVDVR